jgi:DNA helicase HerA-like ATPase
MTDLREPTANIVAGDAANPKIDAGELGRAPAQIGAVTEVSGFRLSCRLFDRAVGENGDCAYMAVQIGALIKILTPTTLAFGFVDKVSFERATSDGGDHGSARADIDLLGELQLDEKLTERAFVRGITVYPVLGAAVFAASEDDISLIYENPSADTLSVGSLSQFTDVAACLKTKEFFSKHSAIIGSTGAGKSCALSIVLRSIISTHPNGHVLIIDPHGEYGTAFYDLAERIRPEDLRLPYWLFGFDEIAEILCSMDPLERSREIPILKDAIVHAKKELLDSTGSSVVISVDTPTPYLIGDVLEHISAETGKLLRPDTSQPYVRLITTIRGLMQDPRYRFMFDGNSGQDDMAEILARILRVPVSGHPITVLDISAVPSEIVNVVVSLLCDMVFDFAVWGDRDNPIPILVACEEAHRYIPRDESLGFQLTQRSIARFAKEGRKYGVSLCLVSQRPSELSETVLSQCSTVIALRMTNEDDQNFVRRLLPDANAGLLNTLPTLGQQEAIIVGEGVSHPMRIRFRDLDPKYQPQWAVANFPNAWDDDTTDRTYLMKVIKRWRGW